jgi:hypothetical protein
MPVSKRKLEANRRNAQKSCGPTSPAGKVVSAQNRIAHGLCGKFIVLESECQEDYNDLLERFMQTEKPVDDVERELVAKMARHTWMSERAVRLQNGCILAQPRPAHEPEEEDYAFVAVRTDLDLYIRYQTANDRAYARAAAELAKRRKERQLAERGFESQKRAAAEEVRREKRQIQRDERHKIVVAIDKERLKCAEADAVVKNLSAADIYQKHMAA